MVFMRDLIIRDYFFRFFCHWSDEVRGFFHRIVVFKMFRTRYVDVRIKLYFQLSLGYITFSRSCVTFGRSRRYLPCQTDEVLLSTNKFNRTADEENLVQLTAKARAMKTSKKDTKGGGLMHSLNPSDGKLSPHAGSGEAKELAASPASAFDISREKRMSSFHHAYLDHEQTALDLVLVSKVKHVPPLVTYCKKIILTYTFLLRFYK